MDDLLSKLSPYNILNNLLPGVIFAVLAELLSSYSLIQENIFVGVFVYYFIGMLISRVGSALVAPFLSLIRVVKFVPHERYVPASKKDPLIGELSQSNNAYRSLVAMVVCLFGLLAYEKHSYAFPWIQEHATGIGLTCLLFLMINSYRKQTAYVVSRIKRTEDDE